MENTPVWLKLKQFCKQVGRNPTSAVKDSSYHKHSAAAIAAKWGQFFFYMGLKLYSLFTHVVFDYIAFCLKLLNYLE